MSNSLLDDGQPSEQEKRILQGVWLAFEKGFKDQTPPKWEEFRAQVEAGDGLKRLLNASGDRRSDSPSRAHEKFLRAVLHVMAGMFVASAVLLAAIIGGIGASLPTVSTDAALYVSIFSELMVWLALVLLLGAVAALIIQVLRLCNKRDRRVNGRTGSAIAAVVAILLVFVPSYLATETAVCGAVALAAKHPPRLDKDNTPPETNGTEVIDSTTVVPSWVPVWCASEMGNWFPLPKKEEPIQP